MPDRNMDEAAAELPIWLREHPDSAIEETLERLDREWQAGGGVINDHVARRVADALTPARRARLRAERSAATRRVAS